jgi:ribonuclease HI
VLIAPDGARSEFNGHEPATTNNRMEITAAVEALRRIPAGAEVVLRSDSEYVVNTMTRGWKRNANRELWGQLDDEVARRMVNFEWVRGHGGDPLNDRADELALMGAHEKLAAASRPSDEARESSAAQLLRAGESIRRCAGCGRSFVAASEGDRYCSLVDCQRQARRDG